METFSIMTCGDSRYFYFLKNFEKNIYERYGFFPFIYDLGLTTEQKKELKSPLRKITVPSIFNQKNSNNHIKAVHKPLCIRDCLSYSSKDVLYLDADTISISPFHPEDFKGCDVAITPRHPKERKPSYYINGLLNSGVLFFRNNDSVLNFITLWDHFCQESDTTDQKALSDILALHIDILGEKGAYKWNNLNILLLDPEIYNDVSCRIGKVFHFKNAGRTEKAYQRYRRMAKCQALFPHFLEKIISFNRHSRLFTWRKKN